MLIAQPFPSQDFGTSSKAAQRERTWENWWKKQTDPCSNFSSLLRAFLQEILFFFKYRSRKWVAYCRNSLIFELGIRKFWYLNKSVNLLFSLSKHPPQKASSAITKGSWNLLIIFQLIELGSLRNNARSLPRGATFSQTFELSFSLTTYNRNHLFGKKTWLWIKAIFNPWTFGPTFGQLQRTPLIGTVWWHHKGDATRCAFLLSFSLLVCW